MDDFELAGLSSVYGCWTIYEELYKKSKKNTGSERRICLNSLQKIYNRSFLNTMRQQKPTTKQGGTMTTLELIELAKACVKGLEEFASHARNPSKRRTGLLIQADKLKIQIEALEECKTEDERLALISTYRRIELEEKRKREEAKRKRKGGEK